MSTLNNIQLNESVGVFEIKTQEEFADFLKFEKAILYLQVDWSGPERMARNMVISILNELKINALASNTSPFFKLDCSEDPEENIRNWLDSHSTHKRIYSRGYGDMLLFQHGKVTQWINKTPEYGAGKLKEIIAEWLNPKS